MRGAVVAHVVAALLAVTACVTAQSWRFQSSSYVNADGAALSNILYDDGSWYPADAAGSTVLGGLVDSDVFPAPFYGKNLDGINSSAFDVSWWFRAEYSDAQSLGVLTFKGLNYRANVWVNGALVADNATTAGAFQYFDIVITKYIQAGQPGAVAVELFRPEDNVRGGRRA